MRSKKKLTQRQADLATQRSRKRGQKALADSRDVVEDGSARRSAGAVPSESPRASTTHEVVPKVPQYVEMPLEKGEPNVRRDANNYIGIEVWRGREWVRVIMQAPHIELTKVNAERWDRDYRRFNYPVGKAAWRLLAPQHGFQHTYTDKARKILEAIMAHYLIDLPAGRVAGVFGTKGAAEASAKAASGLVAVDETTILDADLTAIGKALRVEVPPERKAECARAIMSILSRTENEMPEGKKRGGAGRAKAELTSELKAKIKAFLEKNKDLPYSKCMKAASAAGFSTGHVKQVRKEVGHRTKDTWAKDAGKDAKPKKEKKAATTKPKKEKKDAKAPAKKKDAKAPAKKKDAKAPAKKKDASKPKTKGGGKVTKPKETKPAQPQETKETTKPAEQQPTTEQQPAAAA